MVERRRFLDYLGGKAVTVDTEASTPLFRLTLSGILLGMSPQGAPYHAIDTLHLARILVHSPDDP
jgi:hypothetical protein